MSNILPKIIVLRGLSGSGKSYWAKQYIKDNPNTKIVCKDDLRAMLDDNKWTKNNENFVLKVRDLIILASIEEGKNVIVADTNLAIKHIEHITKLVKDKATVEIKSFLDIPIETCIKQDLQRLNSVGKDVILKQYYDFICTKEKLEYDGSKPNCIIVDLDGTLAINNHNRSFYDASTCDKDDVCKEVLGVIQSYSGLGNKVIFVTGREEKYREPTVKFLSNCLYEDSLLLMRNNGDSRKDYVIKEELFKEFIEPNYNVQFVIDDRPSVCRMWSSLGLFVFKVGREYEF